MPDAPEPQPRTDLGNDAHTHPPKRPRWVTALLIAGALVVLAVVVTGLLGEGHGPGRHGMMLEYVHRSPVLLVTGR